MENLIVIKTDLPLNPSILTGIVNATKATVVILPLKCTITSGEDALRELQNYKEVLERFCKTEAEPYSKDDCPPLKLIRESKSEPSGEASGKL